MHHAHGCAQRAMVSAAAIDTARAAGSGGKKRSKGKRKRRG